MREKFPTGPRINLGSIAVTDITIFHLAAGCHVSANDSQRAYSGKNRALENLTIPRNAISL